MKSENDYGYLRDFIDLVPDPLVIINKKTFKIYFVNQEFQNFLKKSFSLIKNTHLNELFNNDLFFLSNLREISKQCILLEDHLSQKEKSCTDCIIKHFLTLEALSEEAITLDIENKQDIKDLPTKFRDLQKQWYKKEKTNHDISQNIRKIRKNIMINSFPIIFSENAKGCSVDGKKCKIKNEI